MAALDTLHNGLQSVLLAVPEAEPLVDEFRAKGDWSRKLGVPAHITVAGPWPLSVDLQRQDLSALALAARGTRFRLDRIAMVGTAVSLIPDDDRALEELRSQVLSAVGKRDSLDGDWRPHLTIGRDGLHQKLDAVRAELDNVLPVDVEVSSLFVARLVEPGNIALEEL
jgi:2'-5' RNA ligase